MLGGYQTLDLSHLSLHRDLQDYICDLSGDFTDIVKLVSNSEKPVLLKLPKFNFFGRDITVKQSCFTLWFEGSTVIQVVLSTEDTGEYGQIFTVSLTLKDNHIFAILR